MKNVALFIVMLIISQSINAQLQEENFSSSELPQGWKFNNTTNSSKWFFGYKGVMPYSGPTIESEFTSGAALFNDGNSIKGGKNSINLVSPVVDLSQISNAHLEVTYNLQVSESQGKFVIEVYDGSSWNQIYSQETASPKNTGMNEMVLLDVGDFINDSFQVKFVFNDQHGAMDQSLGIDHYKLSESSLDAIENTEAMSGINFLNFSDSVLVLDANENLDMNSAFKNLGEHLKAYELTTDTLMHNLSEFEGKSNMFRVQDDTNVGSFKVLTK